MTLPAVGDAAYPTPTEVADRIREAIRYAYAQQGLTANILPGSDHYIRADKYAARVSIAIANNQIALADSNPLTATGDALVTLAGIFGVVKRTAVGAAGPVVIASAAAVSIPTGFQCTSPDGQTYQVITGATIASGESINVLATTAGAASDQLAGTVMTWSSAAIGTLSPLAVVGAGGLTGGADTDKDEVLRTRLLNHLANPAVGGNASAVTGWAEESSASVEAAYCYPAARGPASYDVAVTAVGGDRTLSAAALAPVEAYILARMPGQNSLNLTSVTPNPLDVVLSARLPLPVAAGGAGGGWRDSAPWPAEIALCTAYSAPTATIATVSPPIVGQAIGIWTPTGLDANGDPGVMREYTVATVGGVSGAYTITVQGGFVESPLAGYLSAGAEFLVDYAATFRASMAALGPGQKTTLPELLPLAARKPAVDAVAPSDLTSKQLATLTNAYPEILTVAYEARYDAGTVTPRSSPPVPAASADPPGILTLNRVAFYYTP